MWARERERERKASKQEGGGVRNLGGLSNEKLNLNPHLGFINNLLLCVRQIIICMSVKTN